MAVLMSTKIPIDIRAHIHALHYDNGNNIKSFLVLQFPQFCLSIGTLLFLASQPIYFQQNETVEEKIQEWENVIHVFEGAIIIMIIESKNNRD